MKHLSLYGAFFALACRLVKFLAEVDGVALPPDAAAWLIALSSFGWAMALTFGTAHLAQVGPRNKIIAAGWCVLLGCVGLILWPDIRTGIEGR